MKKVWPSQELNPGPLECKSSVLPLCYGGLVIGWFCFAGCLLLGNNFSLSLSPSLPHISLLCPLQRHYKETKAALLYSSTLAGQELQMAESLTHVGLKFRPRGRNTTGDTKSIDMIEKTGKGWMQGPYGTVFCSVGTS